MGSKYTGEKKDDKFYINKVIENIDAIIGYIDGISFEQFNNNNVIIDAVMFRLIQMVENINKISNDFKTINNEIPWHKIIGFRNGIVHEYGKTDYSIVYDIITMNINDLKNKLKLAIKN